jgi:hypothetical protein
MKPNRAMTLLFLLLAAGSRAPAQETNAPQQAPFDPYKNILRNNAFNESRRSDDYLTGRQVRPKVETIMLTGTSLDPKDGTAFFSGDGVSDRKEYHVGDTIADFKISKITIDSVTVTNASTNKYVITVDFNPTLRREGSEAWHLTGYVAPTSAPTNAPPETAASAAPASGKESDIIERLRKKRLQE